VAAPEDDGAEFLPFKMAGTSYLRLGHKRDDGNHLWETGDLWTVKKDGSRNKYVGCLGDDGQIDDEVDEPNVE
jgi:hypothetical protein